jgi:hypothetical protein
MSAEERGRGVSTRTLLGLGRDLTGTGLLERNPHK